MQFASFSPSFSTLFHSLLSQIKSTFNGPKFKSDSELAKLSSLRQSDSHILTNGSSAFPRYYLPSSEGIRNCRATQKVNFACNMDVGSISLLSRRLHSSLWWSIFWTKLARLPKILLWSNSSLLLNLCLFWRISLKECSGGETCSLSEWPTSSWLLAIWEFRCFKSFPRSQSPAQEMKKKSSHSLEELALVSLWWEIGATVSALFLRMSG